MKIKLRREKHSRKSKQRNKCRKNNNMFKKLKLKKEENSTELKKIKIKKPIIEAEFYDNNKKCD